MCGITGFWTEPSKMTVAEDHIRQMTDTLAHRGPDDAGYWVDPACGMALGHRRLSIIDISPEGHQPMFSAHDRYAIVFNGEIYNFSEIRQKLEGAVWRGHSDTEVMLAAIEAWGVEEAVKQFVGMFAFALWDRAERSLYLVRDRLGIKPLYYGRNGSTLFFGSELRAFREHPDFNAQLNHKAVGLYLRYRYIPGPESIYQDVHKLPPGTLLKLRSPRDEAAPVPYWSAYEVAQRGVSSPFQGSEAEACACLHHHLLEAVRCRMVADVPLGAFLSGGIDSSTVVALMQAQSSTPIKTFAIGFHEAGWNEAEHAQAVAKHLGTDHTELYVSPQDAAEVIPELATIYDEPFASTSQIPTLLVSRLARQSVTVSLSGDGGDELFAGYTYYPKLNQGWQRMSRIPPPLRKASARALGGFPRFTRASQLLATDDIGAFRRAVRDYQWNPHKFLKQGNSHEDYHSEQPVPPTQLSPLESLMYWDMTTSLPDSILTKLDRASMRVHLEARVPLLDHRVVELAWSFPEALKLTKTHGKQILRSVLYKYVPRELVERPKTGFSVPIGAWIRGPHRDWAESLLSEDALNKYGILETRTVRARWQRHLEGTGSGETPLWNILMLQAWLEKNKPSIP